MKMPMDKSWVALKISNPVQLINNLEFFLYLISKQILRKLYRMQNNQIQNKWSG